LRKACHGALVGLTGFAQEWTQSLHRYSNPWLPGYGAMAEAKILFLLHSLLKEIQECLVPRDEHVCAFVDKLLRRRKADAAVATGDERDFSFKPVHDSLL
jgi:hypothetical protein